MVLSDLSVGRPPLRSDYPATGNREVIVCHCLKISWLMDKSTLKTFFFNFIIFNVDYCQIIILFFFLNVFLTHRWIIGEVSWPQTYRNGHDYVIYMELNLVPLFLLPLTTWGWNQFLCFYYLSLSGVVLSGFVLLPLTLPNYYPVFLLHYCFP